MKIKIDNSIINSLNQVKGLFLFLPSKALVFRIMTYDTIVVKEKEIIGGWFKKIEQEIDNIYLIDLKLYLFDPKDKQIKILQDDGFIMWLIYSFDLIDLRSYFLNKIQLPIEAAGFQFKGFKNQQNLIYPSDN